MLVIGDVSDRVRLERERLRVRARPTPDPHLGVGVHPVPGLAHDRHHVRGQGVAGLRTIHRDDERAALQLDQAVGGFSVLRHGVSVVKNKNVF